MTYSIAIVDEGLLDLTRFKTPDPHGDFYARKRLGVKSWDLYDYVIGAWGGNLERILTIGGDEAEAALYKQNKLTALSLLLNISGLSFGKGEKATHNFILPHILVL